MAVCRPVCLKLAKIHFPTIVTSLSTCASFASKSNLNVGSGTVSSRIVLPYSTATKDTTTSPRLDPLTKQQTRLPRRPRGANAKQMYSYADALFDDMSMRTLICGMYPKCISDVIIKRKENQVTITFYVYQWIYPTVLYFLKGLSERVIGEFHGVKVNVDARYAPGVVLVKTAEQEAYKLGQT